MRPPRLQSGSVLLTVLVSASLLFLICLTVLSIAEFGGRRRQRYAETVRARWLAEGELEYLLARLSGGGERLAPREYNYDADLGRVTILIEPTAAGSRRFRLVAKARSGTSETTLEREIETVYPTDYAVTHAGNWAIESRYQAGIFTGPVFVSGDLDLACDDSGGMVFCAEPDMPLPLITAGGRIFVEGLDGGGTIEAFRARIDPYATGTNWSARRDNAPLMENGETLYQAGTHSEAREDPAAAALVFPAFDRIFGQMQAAADPSFRLLGKTRGNFPEMKIVNPRLLSKDLIGIGDGSTHLFQYEPADRPIEQIYFRRVPRGGNADRVFIDPIADADAIGNKYFTAQNGYLHLPGPGTRIYLQLGVESFRRLGFIHYGTRERSYCSIEHPLTMFFVNTLSESSQFEQGTHYRIDTINRRFDILSHEMLRPYLTRLGSRGDGRSLGFTVPDTVNIQYVYVNGILDPDWKKERNEIFFAKPPPAGAEIMLAGGMPRLFAQKDPPPSGVGLFVDKIVTVSRIDLSTINHYPGRGLIVADRPLYVTGKASFPVTIASSEDIYISNINRDEPEGSAVGIISGGVVWVENSDQQTNISWRVHIHSGADRIYTTASRRPMSQYDTGFAQANGIIVGSVHLEGRIRNMASDYPRSLADRAARIFSEEPFFSVQYRHDPAFLDPRNLPPGIIPLIRLSRWTR